jgi:hypothetical protein
MRTYKFIAVGLILFAACAKLDPVKTGQSFKTDGVKVQVVSVSDSRCPTGATCVTEGKVLVDFLATKGADSEAFQLQLTGTDQGTDTILMGYVFKLKSVTPFPDVNDPSTQNDAEKLVDLSILKQ